jgi:apolipoprotein N-acyltransferase
VANAAVLPANDPYADRPSFWVRHGAKVWALVVFACTVAGTVLAFPPFKGAEFAYTAFAPAIFWAYLRPGWRLYLGTMLAAQTTVWFILLFWLHHVTWGGLGLFALFLGVLTGLWFVAVRWVAPQLPDRPILVRLSGVLALAGAWVVLEWVRGWFLSGFPWLPLAASQWQRATILQIAAFTGAGGISFVLVMLNLGMAAFAHRLSRERHSGLNRRSQEFMLALFLLIVCMAIHVQETFNRGRFSQDFARLALVQPYVPQAVKWDPANGPAILQTLEELTLAAARTRPDLILWPEAVTPWAVRGDERVKDFVEDLVTRAGTPLLLGSIAVEQRGTADERWFNGVMAVTPDFGLQPTYYAKRRLVPFGEFVPFRSLLGWISKFVEVGGDFEAGDDAQPLVVGLRGGVTVVGPLLCYEDIFSNLALSSVRSGADILMVFTNNGWFGEGGAAYQHAAHSVLRAVETRRPVIRVGNGGWSGWIDEFGSVRAVLNDTAGSVYFRGTQTIAVSRDVRWIGRNSFFVEHGNWFVMLCVALMTVGYMVLKLETASTVGPRPKAPAEPDAPVTPTS